MKDAPRETVTIQEGDRFDDEITLPLRIICEGKTDPRVENRQEPPPPRDARGQKAHQPGRAV